ncbi:MAG TPA: glycoside hydrolase family 2 protein [Propionibacteriaceae bacterium]|jgi:beta-mannosidase|nr:glycoside hydrolase family 2 protein [Propionibacteriaceae bacterium]
MLRTDLRTGWTVRAIVGDWDGRAPGNYPAEVPGCVHTDLMAAGVIPDPYLDGNEAALTWMYDIDWRYATTLDPDALDLESPASDERVDLVFEGIDTIGSIRIGGDAHRVELGRTYNMHRSYRFDISPHLDGSSVDMEVDLQSATGYVEAERDRLEDRPRAYGPPYNFIRKMACSFGWDWGPDFRTAGLWKPVLVERWRVARLAQVRPIVTLDAAGTGRVELRIDLERLDPNASLTITADILGHRVERPVDAGAGTATLVIDVPDAPVWWPIGYGEQPLAELTVALSTDDQELDIWQRRLGFRTVKLDTSPDENGTQFTLSVNDRPLFAKGVNWIPDDHFLTRITAERLERRLDQAVAANVNLLRVWGGGIYETEDFYRACDERGLLVWQDFLLACAAYPEESPLWNEIEAEARENVVRLMPHPSLVLFNGGNENLWGHEDWGWQERLDGRTWGARYAFELFPRIVAELDPTRPYCDNSPYSPRVDGRQAPPNDPDHGTHHQWDVWNKIDYTAYRSEIPRFCSEFGFQAPPAWRTLIDWVHAVDGGPLAAASDPKNDPNFLLHQKAAEGNGKLDRGLDPHLGVPANFTDWHWATQLNQARAVRYAIDHYRRWWPRTAGAIVWQLNDCWPVTSWAAIDSEERPKPLWYALRRAFAPRMVVFAIADGVVSAVLLNDTDEVWQGELELSRQNLGGLALANASFEVDIEPRTVASIALPVELSMPGDSTAEIVVARVGTLTQVHTFVEDLELALDANPIDVEVMESESGYAVTVTARSLARDVTLLADRAAADATVDDALVTLPAGQSTTFQVRTSARDLEQVLGRPPVLRTANDLQHTKSGVKRG